MIDISFKSGEKMKTREEKKSNTMKKETEKDTSLLFFNNPKLTKLIVVAIGLFLALASADLSFQLINVNHYERLNVYITLVVSFICSLVIYKYTYKKVFKLIKEHKLFSFICIIVCLILMKKFYDAKATYLMYEADGTYPNLFRLRYYIFIFFPLTYYLLIILNACKKWIIDFYHTLDDWDKKAYVISTFISICLIVVSYAVVPGFYKQFDNVYSMDSSFAINNQFNSATYYSIQHPLIIYFTYPLFVIFTAFLKGFISGNIYYLAIAIFFQILNSQFLILSGLLLKKLSDKKIVYILFMLSFSTLTYTLFMEKYQICLFFLVLYFYTLCTKKDKSTAPIVCASGTILTSAFAGVGELIVKDKFKNKVKKILKIIVIAVLTFICLGQAHLLFDFFKELTEPMNDFASKTFPFYQHIISTINMIQSTIVALPSISANTFWWSNVLTLLTPLGVGIFVLIVIGIFVSRKSLFTKLNTSWLIFAFVLFCILNWSVNISPLFNIYFSGATIPLFVEGMDFVIEKLKLNRTITYTLFIVGISVINLSTILSIARFMLHMFTI